MDKTESEQYHLDYQRMINHFVNQQQDKGAKLLSILANYISHFSYNKAYLTDADQKDILQNICIKIYQNHHKVRTNYYGWVFKVAYNACIDRVKENSAANVLVSMSASNEILSVDRDDINLPALADNITDTLDCFEYVFDEIVNQSGVEQDRDIYFQYVLGKTNAEIGEMLGRTEGTIAKRISILKSRVKDLFTKFC